MSNSNGGSASGKPHGSALETLETIVGDLSRLVSSLKEPSLHAELVSKLHDAKILPDKKIESLAGEAVDLLDEAKQILQPSQLVLADHFMGYYLSTQSLVAAVAFKIPDILHNSPGLTVLELAREAGVREDRLRPVMRLLHNKGIFTYDASRDSYTNNPRSELVRTDHWTQWHTWVDLYATEFYDMARGIPASLRCDENRTAGQITYDTDDTIFSYFEKQGWIPRVHRAFNASQGAQAPGILMDYPWHEIGDKTVLDLGGGGGALMASLLRAHPIMRGGILDVAAVMEHTRPFFHSPNGQFADVGDRIAPIDLIDGDFLDGFIPPQEVYVMKWCLHNWLDPEAVRILRNIRDSIVPGDKSRLVVLDAVLRDGAMGRLTQYGDVQMLMSVKGRERTVEEWEALARASGWEVRKIYSLRNAWVDAIEMRPAALPTESS
ncbi:O-methyltransferase aclM [Colletotrichum orbiculare MAFF 240422]|uniref:O-methyltransferase aclM n=1 Tax=Colletotrichum orbiculare (strain 104-T / ATCC 96160 / CBS 514.97 / LARS 414 / MAFF 240422) TaxID=1213857 RepID=N4VB55_COLOR|nr:O-methyltransferase aclM [Colletotrichum orbiculare MAFF 240422]